MTCPGSIVEMEVGGEAIDTTSCFSSKQDMHFTTVCPKCALVGDVMSNIVFDNKWKCPQCSISAIIPDELIKQMEKKKKEVNEMKIDNIVNVKIKMEETKPKPKPEPKSEIIKPKPAEKKPPGDIDVAFIRCGHMKMKNECMRKEQYKHLYRYGICDCDPNCMSYRKQTEEIDKELAKLEQEKERKAFEKECEQHKGEVYNNYTKTWSWL